MTIVSKAALAAELGISRARVSQYTKGGMPVRSDGKLDREDAVTWIAANHVDRLNERHGGVARASAIAKRVRKPKSAVRAEPDPAHEPDLWQVAAELVGRSGEIAARAAVQAGAGLQIAYAVDQMVCVQLWAEAERLLDMPVGYRSPFEAMVDAKIGEPDWPALAEEAGEPVPSEADLDAWSSWADRLPWFAPERAHG